MQEIQERAKLEDDEITRLVAEWAVVMALLLAAFWKRIESHGAALTAGALAAEWNELFLQSEVAMGDLVAKSTVTAYGRSLAQAAEVLGDQSIVRMNMLQEGALDRMGDAAASRARLAMAEISEESRAARNRLVNGFDRYASREEFLKAVEVEIEAMGISKKKVPWGLLGTLANTYAAVAYAEGLALADAIPAIRAALWGYTYSDVGDSRVREEHHAMNGMTQPLEWPGWKHYTPPVFWNCRCFRVRRWNKENPQVVEAKGYPPPEHLFNP